MHDLFYIHVWTFMISILHLFPIYFFLVGGSCISQNFKAYSWSPKAVCIWENNQFDDYGCWGTSGMVFLYCCDLFYQLVLLKGVKEAIDLKVVLLNRQGMVLKIVPWHDLSHETLLILALLRKITHLQTPTTLYYKNWHIAPFNYDWFSIEL